MRSKKTAAAITTACVGMAVGTAAYMLSDQKSMKSRSKKLKKTTGKALRQMGSILENVTDMMR